MPINIIKATPAPQRCIASTVILPGRVTPAPDGATTGVPSSSQVDRPDMNPP
jgi:hypothetical protein